MKAYDVLWLDMVAIIGKDVQIVAKSREYFGLKKWPLSEGRKEISQYIWLNLPSNMNY